jgi:hypothetical protein
VHIVLLPETDGDVVACEVIDGAVEGVFERCASGADWYRHPVGGELLAAPSAEVSARREHTRVLPELRARGGGEVAELAVVEALRDTLVACGAEVERDDSSWWWSRPRPVSSERRSRRRRASPSRILVGPWLADPRTYGGMLDDEPDDHARDEYANWLGPRRRMTGMKNRGASIAFLAAVGVALGACGSSTKVDEGAGGSAGGAGSGGGAASGGGGGSGPLGPNLFACGVTPDCWTDGGHLGAPPSAESLRCAAELVLSGARGAVLYLVQPGPEAVEQEYLTVLPGDGAAFRQSRARCLWGDGCSFVGPDWELSELTRCDVVIDPEKVAGCDEPEGPCEWSTGDVASCSPVAEAWSCGDLP